MWRRSLALLLAAATLRLASAASQAGVSVELMSFNSSGYLASGRHCDPFWFTGKDNCDVWLKICVELYQSSTPGATQCGTPWRVLGQVTRNQNGVTFAPGKRYGGFSNPLFLPFPANAPQPNWQGFVVKIVAMDSDLRGQAQLIDSWAHRFASANDTLCPVGGSADTTRTYAHPRAKAPVCHGVPNCPSYLTLAWAGTNCVQCPRCYNGGTVTTTASGQCQCACPLTFSGPQCQAVHCANGGTATPNNTCTCPMFYSGPFCQNFAPHSCYDWFKNKGLARESRFPVLASLSNVYNITLTSGKTLPVYCDMTRNGSTVIQTRMAADASSVNFNQTWDAYKSTIGILNGSHYLGNDNIYQLTNIPGVPMRLRVVVRECGDNSNPAPSYTYGSFRLVDSVTYALNVSSTMNTGGGAGDSLNFAFQSPYANNGQPFATYDRPGSGLPSFLGTCSGLSGGGWWYGTGCGSGNLNSAYHANCKAQNGYGIRWLKLNSDTTYSMAFTRMEILPHTLY